MQIKRISFLIFTLLLGYQSLVLPKDKNVFPEASLNGLDEESLLKQRCSVGKKKFWGKKSALEQDCAFLNGQLQKINTTVSSYDDGQRVMKILAVLGDANNQEKINNIVEDSDLKEWFFFRTHTLKIIEAKDRTSYAEIMRHLEGRLTKQKEVGFLQQMPKTARYRKGK